MTLEVIDQRSAVGGTLVRLAKGVQFQSNIGDAQQLPETRDHHDHFGIDVRPGHAERLDVDLVKLAIPAALRALVAEHRPHRIDALRTVVKQIVLDTGSHDACGELGAHGQGFAVERIGKRIHFLFDDIGDFADASSKQPRVFEDRGTHVAVPVGAQPVAYQRFELLPPCALARQCIVHAADGGDLGKRVCHLRRLKFRRTAAAVVTHN